MSTPINEIQVECHSALGGDTSIIVGDQIINMRQLHLGYSGQSVKTFAINTKTYQLDECKILEVPQEIYTSSIVRIGLHYGQHFECTPTSLILTSEGFKPADSVKKGDALKVLYFNQTTGESFTDNGFITTYEYDPVLTLQIPVYLFISEYQNILLPYYKEGAEMAAFVNVRQ